MSSSCFPSRLERGRGEPARSVFFLADEGARFARASSETLGGLQRWQRGDGALGLLLRRSSGSRQPSSGRASGVSTGEVVTRLRPPSLGNACAPRCHPAVGPLPPGCVFPGAGGSPGAMPLRSPGGNPPAQAPSCHHHCRQLPLSPVRGAHRAGSSGGPGSRFLAARGWQQLLCIMESYLRSLKPLCQAVAFFLSRSRHPAFACAVEGGTEVTSWGK